MSLSYDGRIQTTDIPLDIVSTVESGQTFLWRRHDTEMFNGRVASQPTYSTVRRIEGNIVAVVVREQEDALYWQSNSQSGGAVIKQALRLDDELHEIQETLASKDPAGVLSGAFDEFTGLRVPCDPLFPTVISFICSTQMRVPRIHGMVHRIAEMYGPTIQTEERSFHAFPTPEQLAEATEEELKALKLGYRARYVHDTAQDIASGKITIESLPNSVDKARSCLKQCTGVGDKVADCILLYGAGYVGTVPVDTWIETAVNEHYPSCVADSSREMAENLESLFGENAGYAQTYLFHFHREQA